MLSKLTSGVMVAQRFLAPFVGVRVPTGQRLTNMFRPDWADRKMAELARCLPPSVPPFFASGFCRAIRRERRACKFACLPLILGEPQKPATARISRNSRADIPEHCAVRQEDNRKQGAICRARKREMNFSTRKSANIRKDITPKGGPPSPLLNRYLPAQTRTRQHKTIDTGAARA